MDKVPWCILIADDIVSIDESRDDINFKLKRWQETLESNNFIINHTNIK